MKTPEGAVKAEIKKVLTLWGDDLYYCMPVQTGYGARTLDFLICFRGRFIAVEAKRPGKGPTKLQAHIIEQIRKAGGSAICADNASDLHVLLGNIGDETRR